MVLHPSQINTGQGRYVLTSTGDLQIVQVHRSDSGTYVCVADNGIGAPVQREVQLNVAGKFPTNVIGGMFINRQFSLILECTEVFLELL